MHARINSLLKSVFDVSDREVAQDLTKDDVLKWDSLTHMDLIASIEKEFGIQLTFDDILAMNSFHKIRLVVTEKVTNYERHAA